MAIIWKDTQLDKLINLSFLASCGICAEYLGVDVKSAL